MNRAWTHFIDGKYRKYVNGIPRDLFMDYALCSLVIFNRKYERGQLPLIQFIVGRGRVSGRGGFLFVFEIPLCKCLLSSNRKEEGKKKEPRVFVVILLLLFFF